MDVASTAEPAVTAEDVTAAIDAFQGAPVSPLESLLRACEIRMRAALESFVERKKDQP